jgi:hypothetical protein
MISHNVDGVKGAASCSGVLQEMDVGPIFPVMKRHLDKKRTKYHNDVIGLRVVEQLTKVESKEEVVFSRALKMSLVDVAMQFSVALPYALLRHHMMCGFELLTGNFEKILAKCPKLESFSKAEKENIIAGLPRVIEIMR